MKTAVYNPWFIFQDPAKNFCGFNLAYLMHHAEAIYISSPWRYFKFRRRLKELKIDKPIFLSMKTLNSQIDLLLGFDGEPYQPLKAPPSAFHGRKVWHAMDYVFHPQESLRALQKGGVDTLLGYHRHDLYCPFFQHYYAPYQNRVIPLPFGFGDRFHCLIPFHERIPKCTALGSINPINDPLVPPGMLQDYIAFYPHLTWTHEFRRQLAEKQGTLPFLSSKLPRFPDTKNPLYDPVKELNQHQLFVNDEGLMNFPPARTFEGIACGAIMVASRNPIYEAYGFEENVHYLAFEKNNLDDFERVVRTALQNPSKLAAMHTASLELARRFTHTAVAHSLHASLQNLT